ncbi:Mpv17/PMP22 family protein [Drepanopeziza brunnea f. sp. 'multigermtubi' MB_m1]|uniref:Mpv17/PMP22 family protein n=1 Tax=Marssonina brunnea f. sp. multigermtubi (strain MB_m1) TaxID=1072389 RepID=K1Y0Q0_MARBU|nr:Mpv17/PMP22 family protein [Drepanopeziza brunnea f. sp. 'multigermtubi' MB_m1]EKD18669.1 Mpv17/PMP22 family protein [Drepanopeziza brunnea f. sp. 'multigermtubi' MB_m1]
MRTNPVDLVDRAVKDMTSSRRFDESRCTLYHSLTQPGCPQTTANRTQASATPKEKAPQHLIQLQPHQCATPEAARRPRERHLDPRSKYHRNVTAMAAIGASVERVPGIREEPTEETVEQKRREIGISALTPQQQNRFMFLGNNFNYASKTLSLATKVAVNQICFTPLFNTYFFGMQSFLSGDSLPEVWERIKRTVPTSILNSCKLWPAVTAFSFTFIDAQYRSIFAGFIAIGWQTYLSFLNRRAEIEAAAKSGDIVPIDGKETKECHGVAFWVDWELRL